MAGADWSSLRGAGGRVRPAWLTIYALYLLLVGLAGLLSCPAVVQRFGWAMMVPVAAPSLLSLCAGVGLLRLRSWGLACAVLLMLLQITVTILAYLRHSATGQPALVTGALIPVFTALVLLALRRRPDLLD